MSDVDSLCVATGEYSCEKAFHSSGDTLVALVWMEPSCDQVAAYRQVTRYGQESKRHLQGKGGESFERSKEF